MIVGSINDYLTSIGRHPVLAPEAQLRHCQRIHTWINWPEGRDAAPERVIKAGRRSMDAMVRTNLRLVVSIAAKYQGRGLDMGDLIQEGNIGLIRGLELFDPFRGYSVTTYTYWWIRQGISRALHSQGRMIRLPINSHETVARIQRFKDEFHTEHGRSPTFNEIVEKLNVKPQRLRELLDQYTVTHCVSTDTLIHDGDTSLIELLADPSNGPFDGADDAALCDLLHIALTFLPEREAFVIRANLLQGQSLGTIGKSLGISRSRAGQFLQSGLTRIRQIIQTRLASDES